MLESVALPSPGPTGRSDPGLADPSPTDSDFDLATRLRLAVTRLSRRLRQQSEGEVTPAQLSALAVLEHHGSLSLGELAAHEQVQPPTMTRMVAALEALGLVLRQPDAQDRRMVRASVTPAGRRLIKATRLRKTAFLATRLQHLTPQELSALERAVPVLERLVEDTP